MTREQANEIKRLAGLYAAAPYRAAFSQELVDAQARLHAYVDALIDESVEPDEPTTTTT